MFLKSQLHDILSYIENRKTKAPSQPSISQGNQTVTSSPAVSMSGDVEIVEMDRMRKLIADHMVMSKHTSPHVTSYVEADVTNIVMWRNKVKKAFEQKENEKNHEGQKIVETKQNKKKQNKKATINELKYETI